MYADGNRPVPNLCADLTVIALPVYWKWHECGTTELMKALTIELASQKVTLRGPECAGGPLTVGRWR